MSLSSVFIVDDHPMLLAAIESLICNQSDLVFAGSASTGECAVDAIELCKPDIVIVDMSLPGMNGVTLINRLRGMCHPPYVIVLSACEEPSYVRQSLAAGASGYVTKRSAAIELLQAIYIVRDGGSYVEPRISARIIFPTENHDRDPDILSHRELSVLKLVAKGYCNKEISAMLNVSIKTVETYRVRANDKLEIHNRAALVRYAQANGWLAEAN